MYYFFFISEYFVVSNYLVLWMKELLFIADQEKFVMRFTNSWQILLRISQEK